MAPADNSSIEIVQTETLEVRMTTGSNGSGHHEIPLPRDKALILLSGIFLLLFLFALYFARDVVLPIVFAFVLNLMLLPAMRGLTAMYIPRGIAAAVAIILLFGTIVGFGYALSGPATEWIAKAPQSMPRLQQRLSFVVEPQGASLQVILPLLARPPDRRLDLVGSAPAKS